MPSAMRSCSGQDCNHPGHGCGVRCVDAGDSGGGMGGAQHGHIGGARNLPVVGVVPLAGQEPLVFDARHGLTDAILTHQRFLVRARVLDVPQSVPASGPRRPSSLHQRPE